MLPQEMKAAVLNKPKDIEVKKVSVPKINVDEVLIRVHCIGVCGSDVHYYEHGRIGRYVVEEPIILGHEMAGEVVQVGENVTNVQVGDRVAVEPGATCGRCKYCKEGRYNLCPDVVFMATPPVDGAWAEYVAMRSDYLFKLPDGVSYEVGAMLEPLSVGMHSMKRGRVSPGDKILITGLGPIGLLAAQAAKLYGVHEIYGSDVASLRREVAEDMGFTEVYHPVEDDLVSEIMALTNNEGVDVVIETSGNQAAIAQALKIVKRGGRVVWVGMPSETEIPIDVTHVVDAELDIYGVFRFANTYPVTLQALKGVKDINIEKIVTHKYSLDRIEEAIEMARTEKDKSIKVMIYPEHE